MLRSTLSSVRGRQLLPDFSADPVSRARRRQSCVTDTPCMATTRRGHSYIYNVVNHYYRHCVMLSACDSNTSPCVVYVFGKPTDMPVKCHFVAL